MLARGAHSILYLGSSIIAQNTIAGVTPDDLYWQGDSGGGVLGNSNLVIASNVPLPDDTLRSDPLLAPLADNGGPTLTHGLPSNSPAIDRGSNHAALVTDQRGFLRTSGRATDIGAFEMQQTESVDEIFRSGFDAAE